MSKRRLRDHRLVPMFSIHWCVECCDTHEPGRRRAILQRLGNVTPSEVYERLDGLAVHLWGPWDVRGRGTGYRKLGRDIAAVRKANGWTDHLPDKLNEEAVRRFLERGLGPASIAFLLMVPRVRVTDWLKKYGYARWNMRGAA